jgi:hypothetical protein
VPKFERKPYWRGVLGVLTRELKSDLCNLNPKERKGVGESEGSRETLCCGGRERRTVLFNTLQTELEVCVYNTQKLDFHATESTLPMVAWTQF